MAGKEKVFRGSPQYYERVEEISLGKNPLDFISINMSPTCNYRCSICLSGMNGAKAPDNALSLGELLRFMEDAMGLGAFHLEISGEGEPLMSRPILEQIIADAGQCWMHTTIFTNGSLLTEEFLEWLAGQDVSLAISLNHFRKEEYEAGAGRAGTFESVLRNIDCARVLFRKDISERNGYQVHWLAIHSISTGDNDADLAHIREYAGDDIFFSVAPLMRQGNAKNLQGLLPTTGLSTDSSLSDGSLILADSATPLLGRPVCGTFCYGLGIRFDGEVLFDAHAYETAGLFGNVRDLPLRDLVSGLRAAQRLYFAKFSDGGFCPLRDSGYGRFVQHLGGNVT